MHLSGPLGMVFSAVGTLPTLSFIQYVQPFQETKCVLQASEGGGTSAGAAAAGQMPPLNAAAAAAAAQAAAVAAGSPTARSLAPKRGIAKPRGRPPRNGAGSGSRMHVVGSDPRLQNTAASAEGGGVSVGQYATDDVTGTMHAHQVPSSHSADNTRNVNSGDNDTAHSHGASHIYENLPDASGEFSRQPMHAGVTAAAPVAKVYMPPVTPRHTPHGGVPCMQPMHAQQEQPSDSSTLPPLSIAPPPRKFASHTEDIEQTQDYNTPHASQQTVKDNRPSANPEEWDLTNGSPMHELDAWPLQDESIWDAGPIDGSPRHDSNEYGSESPRHGSSESDTGVVMAPAMHGRHDGTHVESGDRHATSMHLSARDSEMLLEKVQEKRPLFNGREPQVTPTPNETLCDNPVGIGSSNTL